MRGHLFKLRKELQEMGLLNPGYYITKKTNIEQEIMEAKFRKGIHKSQWLQVWPEMWDK